MPEVDAEITADERVVSDTTKFVRIEMSGLTEEGGFLEITTSNNEQVVIQGDCEERVCPVRPERRT